MKDTIKASVILVNYNGKQFLNECLNSLFNINFPKENYEVIMVDNDSKDNSIEFVEANFPVVKIVKSEKNLGFAGGCNLGVENAEGRYIVFLNTDTKVEKDWLKYLLKRIKSDDKIAAVSSKAYLYYPFLELSIKSDIYLRSEFSDGVNFQSAGVLIENIILGNKDLQSLVRYRSGFYNREYGSIPARWTMGDASILVPFDTKRKNNIASLTIRSEKYHSKLKTRLSVNTKSKRIIKDILHSYQVKQYRINLNDVVSKKDYLFAVQNAGVVVFKDGYGRDRGAVVKEVEQFYELENEYYQHPFELNAFSGVSVILSKDLFKKVGGFDESYFMYYEDVDCSLRLKRLGYRIVFEPKSVLYHIHSGSSVEWSTFFNYNVEKNYLATLVKHFPYSVVFSGIVSYSFSFLTSLLKTVKWRIKEHWELYDFWKDKFDYRKNVLGWFFNNLPQLFIKRYKLNFSEKNKMSKIYKQLY